MRPDLSDAAARRAYRRELRAIYAVHRMIALGVFTAGGIGLLFSRSRSEPIPYLAKLSWLAIGAGIAGCIFVILLRTRYHRRRMAE